MEPKDILKLVDAQALLAPLDTALTAVADATVSKAGRPLQNFLHGTWFGHPLHAALTDVPLGAWTVAACFDLFELATGSESLRAGADAAIALGLLGSAGAAATGLTDWKHTHPPERRVGALHGVLNLAAMGLFAVSWFQRKTGSRKKGIRTGLLSYAISAAGGWLGGYLVYPRRTGVDQADREFPGDFEAVLPESELTEGKLHRAEFDGKDILLVKLNGRIFALGGKCSHLGGPLAEGRLAGESVICPWHQSRFALADGKVLDGPALYAQPCFEVRVQQQADRGSRAKSLMGRENG